MARIGFLHTAQVHVATFDALVSAAGSDAVHVVQPDLLDRARTSGASPELVADVRAALDDLAARGASVVVCTCSTLGPIAEGGGALRVDRPMARAAVHAGPRVGVIAALDSTLAPTRELLTEEADAAGAPLSITEVCVPEAWAAFEVGDLTSYLAQVADAARATAPDVDVVVLAQASMAGAVDLLADLAVPVLSSPRLAVEAVVTDR